MIDWIRVSGIIYTRCSDDRIDERRGHHYCCPPKPCTERVAESLVEVRVELSHYGFHCRAVILYHVSPPLSIQHYPYPRCTFIELLYHGSPLHDDPTPVIVVEVLAPDLIPLETGVVIYQLSILLICGGIGLSDQHTRDWPISGGVITLYVLHHDLWLRLGVLSLL
jgi:hypothetical protein